MLKIDDELLAEVGLEGLPKWERDLLLTYIYETLEMRVGVKLADKFSNKELDEFEVFFEKKDENGAFEWLQEKRPDYKDVVRAEFELLKAEIVVEVPSILEVSKPETPTSDDDAVDPDDVVADSLTAGERPAREEVKARGRR
jgi:hypothetical protein